MQKKKLHILLIKTRSEKKKTVQRLGLPHSLPQTQQTPAYNLNPSVEMSLSTWAAHTFLVLIIVVFIVLQTIPPITKSHDYDWAKWSDTEIKKNRCPMWPQSILQSRRISDFF